MAVAIAAQAVPPSGTCAIPQAPCTCKSPSYTVTLDTKTTTTGVNGLQTSYRYKITGTSSKIGALSEGQVVVPRPLIPVAPDPTSADIFPTGGSVSKVDTYCQADKNSGVNLGNCDGFIVHVAPTASTSTTVFMEIIGGQRVADGLVTMNLVGGNGSSELCLAVDANNQVINPPTGIVGPGDIGDPFQPKFMTQDATVAGGKCIAHLIFDKRGNVVDVTASNAPGFVPGPGEGCVAGSPAITPSNPKGDIFVQDSNGNPSPLKNNTGPHGFTFGSGTTTCYGPSIPSPAKCVCTKSPCP